MYIHLINAGGPHNNPDVLVYEELSPLKNVIVSVKSTRKPISVNLQPGNKKLSYTYNNNLAAITVPLVDIYSIIEIEP